VKLCFTVKTTMISRGYAALVSERRRSRVDAGIDDGKAELFRK